jgi:hypothetical protein
MAVLDDVKELLRQYGGGGTPTGDAAAHFQQVAESVDSGTLANGIAAAMRSDETPPFAQLVSQLFASGSGTQKSAMLDTLLSAVPPELRAQLSTLIPGLGTPATGTAATTAEGISPDTIQKLAAHVEQRNAGIVDRMSTLYAQHPALVRTLGSTAMMIAMRAIAGRGKTA